MPTGFSSMERDSKNRAFDTPFLKLKSGDIAVIRFITDINQMEWGYFHTLKSKNRLGDKEFTEDMYCKMQDEQRCECCESTTDQNLRKVKVRMFFHVYVYGILHKDPDSDSKWQLVNYAGGKYYFEAINQFKVLKTGPGSQGNIREKIKAWAKRAADAEHPDGTLLNRMYDWTRQGSNMDTIYDLILREGAVREFPQAAKDAIASLPLLASFMKPEKEEAEEKPVAEKIELAAKSVDDLFI
jgi:hypothetical protein